MGSTLTNTQPKDTYKSLLKTSDSTELSATMKTLSDGNGNDSALAVSTKGVSVVKSDTLVSTAASINHYTNNYVYMRGGTAGLVLGDDGLSNRIQFEDNGDIIQEANGIPYTRLTTTGYFRLSSSALGIQFGGDAAAANALDDYEEGTFTPTFGGTTYSGGTLRARYTKIGRLVSYDIFLFNGTFSGSSGPASISGFPFTANASTYGQGMTSYNNCVDGNTNGGYVDANGQTFYFIDENSTALSSFIDGTGDRKIMISGTYTV